MKTKYATALDNAIRNPSQWDSILGAYNKSYNREVLMLKLVCWVVAPLLVVVGMATLFIHTI